MAEQAIAKPSTEASQDLPKIGDVERDQLTNMCKAFLMVKIPESKRRRHSRIALFYEFSTCDLYVRSMFQSSEVKLKDIIGLSIGAKLYTN